MSRDDFKSLIERYADGRNVCNCGEAYYSPCGRGIVNGEFRNDLPACAHGCSANLICAKHEIASKVVAELNKQTGGGCE
jgi:hypothetical protein